jgi:hypothetical protein
MGQVEKKNSRKPIEEAADNGTGKSAKRTTSARKKATGGRAKAMAAGNKATAKTKRVKNYKRHAKREISVAFPTIVKTLVEQAKKGSLTHTKFLFDIGGVKDKPLSQEKREREPSLSEMLLEEVAKRHDESAAETLPKEELAAV